MREDHAMRGRPSGARFVGRADELARLDEAIARLRASEAGGLLVTGEPGIGKSRLVEELCARATDAGQSSGSGTPRPAVTSWPTGRWCPFSGPLGRLDADDALRREEARRRLLGEGAAGRQRPPRAAGAARGGARLRRPARLRPPGRARVGGSHWADAGSAGAVDHLVRNLHDLPVLLVATYRPVELDVAAPIRTGLAELRNSGRSRRSNSKA